MSRKSILVGAVVFAAAAFAVLYFWPRSVQAGAEGSLVVTRPAGHGFDVSGRIHLGDRAVLQPRRGDRAFHGSRDHHHRGHHHRGHHRGGHRDRFPFGGPVVVLPFDDSDTVVEREIIVPQAPPPAAVAPPPTPPEPLDPHGSARIVGVGGERQPHMWVLGDVLPDDTPHVVLDAETYGLPEPPPGQIYARVGHDVLRIDASTGRIYAVLAR